MSRTFQHDGQWRIADLARGFVLFGPDTFDACWSYVAERCAVRRDLLIWNEASGRNWTIYMPDEISATGFVFQPA